MCNREALCPYLSHHDLNEVVEDNASCHNNDFIRNEHKRRGVTLVGYEATDDEKEIIKDLIDEQVNKCMRLFDMHTHMFHTLSDSTLQTGTRPQSSEDETN